MRFAFSTLAILWLLGPAALADQPLKLSLVNDPESVYAPPTPPTLEEQTNQGAINLNFKINYMTDYIFRGIDRSAIGGNSDRANLQFDGTVELNLGKLPHPFITVFTNVYDADPVSRFQIVQPGGGAIWTIRPVILTAGFTGYIYPNREHPKKADTLFGGDTSEVWGKITLMDDAVLRRERPILSPYVMAAYDFDRYNGWYFEAGVDHEFILEGTGLSFTAHAAVGYVRGIELFSLAPGGNDTGFQHYDLGLTARYSLNQAMGFSQRYGQWFVTGYLNYVDGISDRLRSDTQVYGGGGIELRY